MHGERKNKTKKEGRQTGCETQSVHWGEQINGMSPLVSLVVWFGYTFSAIYVGMGSFLSYVTTCRPGCQDRERGNPRYILSAFSCHLFSLCILCHSPYVKYGGRSPKFTWVPCHEICTLHSCTHWLRPRNSPLSPRIGTRITRALLVSKDRRHLFVTPCHNHSY